MAALILGPLLRGGHLLYRDAVSTPRSYVTDTALGLGESPARAVPQDWLIALASHVVDGSVVVIGLTFAALLLAGVGFGPSHYESYPRPARRAHWPRRSWRSGIRLSPSASCRVSGVLLVGYGALGWIVWAAHRCRVHPTGAAWLSLTAWSAAAGITPTGSLFAAFAILAVLVVPAALDGSSVPVARLRRVGGAAVVVVLGSLPWLVASLLTAAPTTSDRAAVDAFAARAETGLGTLGSLAGLGGIWNADAVPSSRGGGWAVIATLCLVAAVVIGAISAWRRRDRIPLLRSMFWLAVITVVLVTLSATAPGRAAFGWVVDTVPGAGLFRDTAKWVALLVPFYAVAAAFAVQTIGRWIPRGLAAAIAIGLIALPLPDLAWGANGSIETITYPRDWAAVAAIVPADAGDIAVLPAGTNRRYGFTGGVVSLDPAARTLRAPVITTGELTVGGSTVDRPSDSRATRVDDALRRGEPPARLAELGVGWVLVEETGDPTSRTVAGLPPAFRGTLLTLYRIPAPAVIRASEADRVIAWTAHVIWLGIILSGFAGACVGCGRRLVQWIA